MVSFSQANKYIYVRSKLKKSDTTISFYFINKGINNHNNNNNTN